MLKSSFSDFLCFENTLFPNFVSRENDPEYGELFNTRGVDENQNYHEIIPGLFLGNFVAARSEKALSDMGVSHVCVVMDGIQPLFQKGCLLLLSYHFRNINTTLSQ